MSFNIGDKIRVKSNADILKLLWDSGYRALLGDHWRCGDSCPFYIGMFKKCGKLQKIQFIDPVNRLMKLGSHQGNTFTFSFDWLEI